MVAAFLRLGLKYNIEVLKTEASSRLAHHFPTSLEVYGDRDDAMITPDRLQPIMAINLARECRGMDRILPMAFFRLVVGFSFQGILCSDIPPDDRNIAIVGWESAVQAQAQETMRWLFQLDSGELYSECLQPDQKIAYSTEWKHSKFFSRPFLPFRMGSLIMTVTGGVIE